VKKCPFEAINIINLPRSCVCRTTHYTRARALVRAVLTPLVLRLPAPG
jgi:translation initiation factor RLI1